jgi:uncharacterized membrane protein
MRRVNIFLIILIASLEALIALTGIGFAVFTTAQTANPGNWMSQMLGGSGTTGMMGQTAQTQATTSTNPLLFYFGILFAALIAVTVVGMAGLGYYLLYPQIRIGVVSVQPTALIQRASAKIVNGVTPYETVSKTLTEEELKIIRVLNAHNGKYLQKYILSETGLSRLKTHRIVARLAERGIVSLEKTGNTNQVFLANWLKQQINAN